jgi:hypothetical protein
MRGTLCHNYCEIRTFYLFFLLRNGDKNIFTNGVSNRDYSLSCFKELLPFSLNILPLDFISLQPSPLPETP